LGRGRGKALNLKSSEKRKGRRERDKIIIMKKK